MSSTATSISQGAKPSSGLASGPGQYLYEFQTITFFLSNRVQVNNCLMVNNADDPTTPFRSVGMSIAITRDCHTNQCKSSVSTVVFLYLPQGDAYFDFDLQPYLEPITKPGASAAQETPLPLIGL